MKNILCAFLALVLAVGLLPVEALGASLPLAELSALASEILPEAEPAEPELPGAAKGTCGENLTWFYDAGTLTISGTGPMTDFASRAVVPWNSFREEIITVIIEPGVTSLGSYCFYGCGGLTAVTIPHGITSLGDFCFSSCSYLTSVIIPDSVTSLGNYCFYYSSRLTSVTIPDSVTSLGDGCFALCTSLTSVTIPDSITSLGEECFFSCSSLTSVTIPGSVASLGTGCFDSCEKLAEITLSEGVKMLGDDCFKNCDSLTVVTIPAGVTSLGSQCFSSCDKLVCVTVKGAADLGSQCFYRCSNLSCVTFDAAATIDSWAFSDSPSIKAITFNGDAPNIHSWSLDDTNPLTAYYPANNPTWTDSVLKDYGGQVTWVPFTEHIHVHGSFVTEPTCTEGGFTTHVCGCGDRYTDEPKEALGHNEVTTLGKEATCTKPGLTDEVTCSVCKAVLQPQTEIPALGHDYVNEICIRCKEEDPAAPKITRIAGSDRHETAFKIADQLKKVLNVEKFDTILIASGENSADALSGSYLAAKMQAPILLSRGKSHQRNLEYIRANLSRTGAVYILGGTGAVPQEMEDLLTENGIPCVRLRGATRFDTNLAILDRVGIQGDEILVSTGYNFADSLSASATGKPMLLVNTTSNALTSAQKTWLEGQRGKTFTIIGGTSAVSAELEAALAEYGTTVRLKGSGREATSVAVAQKYFQSPKAVLLAYSRNFPDGLCGGPLAYAMGAPLLLVNAGKEWDAQYYVMWKGISRGRILGGTGVISDESARTVFGLSQNQEIPKQ